MHLVIDTNMAGNKALATAIADKVVALNSRSQITESERRDVLALQEIARQLLAQTDFYGEQGKQERKSLNN